MTDQELLEGMRSHSKKAVEEVYRKVRPGIISYVCSNRGNAEEADDLIQEIFGCRIYKYHQARFSVDRCIKYLCAINCQEYLVKKHGAI